MRDNVAVGGQALCPIRSPFAAVALLTEESLIEPILRVFGAVCVVLNTDVNVALTPHVNHLPS